MRDKIIEYKKSLTPTSRKRNYQLIGQLMEQLAYLAFTCLRGFDPSSVKSYQSFAAQIDLEISSNQDDWYTLMDLLHLPRSGRTIVVEAKNLKDKVKDGQFSRLCHILTMYKKSTCHLGVFFTTKGATGFPDDLPRQRVLRDARATQILFHASEEKFIVVFTKEDLMCLDQPGALPRLLEEKIRDVETASGMPTASDPGWTENPDLPPHLQNLRP